MKRGKEHLEELEGLDNEIVDRTEINKSVRALVPSLKQELKDGYCHACQAFPTKWSEMVQQYNSDVQETSVPYIASIQHLEAASVAGCRFCRLLFQQIRPPDLLHAHRTEQRLKALGRPTTLLLVQYTRLGLTDLRYMVHGTSIFLERGARSLWVEKIDEPASFSPTLRISNQLIENPINLAKEWLHACTREHPRCKASTTHPIPTRLLVLDRSNTTDGRNDHYQQTVRLVETADWAKGVERVEYATLSHCWGGIDFLKLTTRMLDTFKTSVPFDLLTRTFRDAINVTLDLGLRYIWIDSLCIIQDSVQDWDIEAGRMSSVYGGSSINIAASGARDGSEGLFLKPPNFIGGAYFPPSFITAPYAVALFGLYSSGIPNTHLASRAWAFQERLLSPRTLHFGKTELFWECRTHDACESFPNVFPAALKDRHIRPRKSMYEIWPQIVEMYSMCSVTLSKDKLVALAGVARIAENESGDDYLAGLWRSKMEVALCWMAKKATVRPKHGPYRAPTWSWASVDGGVYYSFEDGEGLEKLSRILDVWVSPLGPDNFGQISGGVLTLGCSAMLAATLTLRHFALVKINATGKNIKIGGRSDEHYEGSEYTSHNEDQDVIVVPMVKITWHSEIPIGNVNQKLQGLAGIRGLLLQPTMSKQGEFRRVGSFIIYSSKCEYELFGAALEELGPRTARECCAETRVDPETGKEQYVITII
ncbi:HET-domain-containing protein [Acephala macrosclerotiorum]|nr:HET-domain-containing protein [Acephala macrosclerotiorum]